MGNVTAVFQGIDTSNPTTGGTDTIVSLSSVGIKSGDKIVSMLVIAYDTSVGGGGQMGLDYASHFYPVAPKDNVVVQSASANLSSFTFLVTLLRS